MAQILTACDGLPSVVFQGVEFARRLAAHGHAVTWIGPETSAPLAARHGLAFHPLAANRHAAWLAEDTSRPALVRLRTIRARRASALSSFGLDSFDRLLRERRPDLLLVNGEMHEHIVTALAAGVPLALLNSFVSIWRQPGLPPPHTMARPGVGWQGTRLGMWLLWTALMARKRARAWWGRARHLGCDRLSLLGDLARRGDLDLAREIDASQWLIPFTYRRLPMLSLHAAEFDFPHRPPARVRYVGPMVLADRLDAPGDAERDRLDTILARRRTNGATATLIYAGFGSAFSTDIDLLRRLFACVAGRPDWELVVSLGQRLLPAELGPVPERVHLFAWVPQLAVLAAADVAVTHGGVNTIDECVLNGLPTLVYCGWETDMGGTTARVVHHGIGLAGDRRHDSASDIGRLLERLIDEPGFRQRVDDLRARYVTYTSARVAEREVEALLAAPRADGTRPAEAPSSRRGRA